MQVEQHQNIHQIYLSTMSTEKLIQLETMLAGSEEFREILRFFMDNFGEKPSFMRDSKKIKAPFILEIIKAGGTFIFQKTPIHITKLMMLNYERLGLIHGGGFVEGHVFNFFYCKRINKGMLTFALKNGSVEYLRITPQPLDDLKLDADFIESVESVTKHYQTQNPN